MAQDARSFTGLSSEEAAARLAAEGPNTLAREHRRSLWRVAADVLSEPMLLLLLAAGAIYLTLGDLAEALLIVALATASIVITIVQETRSERVLEALSDLTSPRALVVRDGERKRIAGREVVRGDLILLSEGDRVPADATLLSSRNLETDESLLTGESLSVRKGEDIPQVYSGSLIVRGQGIARVTATGAQSEIGKIGKSLAQIEGEPPPLREETRRLVRFFAVAGFAVSVLFAAVYWLSRGEWLDAVLGGIALSMSLLPEEFPVILMVFMVMGAWRITRAGVLTRRAAAIETLGSATVLCADKTGTLTENRMTIQDVVPAGDIFAAGTGLAAERVIAIGRLASQIEPYDPMEKAFHEHAEGLIGETLPPAEREMVHQYPLSPGLLAMSNVWRKADGALFIAAKGAPEAIADLCRLDMATVASIKRRMDDMAQHGARVIGVAQAELKGDLPATQRDIHFEFLGLVGLADPLRPNVPEAIGECRSAGIRVIMITGDYPATARAIAEQAGLGGGEAITGSELARLDDAALAERVRTASVFARILPEQKTRIVEALKKNGEIVAMTGDGVNDAPSLKAAHIGIAMGGRGTDVAREASAIVLLHDDFGSIVHAIRLGRRIFDNIRKAMGFVMAAHVPIAGLALLPLGFGLPLILLPVHIAFVEMIVDPVCSIAFEAEPEEGDVMKRPPRKPRASLFTLPLVIWSLLQGALVFAATGAVFLVASQNGLPEDELRSLTFATLILGNTALILAGRSFSASVARAVTRPNKTLWIVLGIDAALLALILTLPAARELFRFGPLHGDDLLLAGGAGIGLLGVIHFLKRYFGDALRR